MRVVTGNCRADNMKMERLKSAIHSGEFGTHNSFHSKPRLKTHLALSDLWHAVVSPRCHSTKLHTALALSIPVCKVSPRENPHRLGSIPAAS